MTPCDEYQTQIVALFDNEARDEDLRLAAGHLEDCPECRAFFLDLIAVRRTLKSAAVPSLSSTTRQAVLDNVRGDRCDHNELCMKEKARFFRLGTLARWAAVLLIGLLAIACFALSREARDLRTRLGASEQEVAAIHEQARLAESQERQQKAISALSFRMAELEERVNRGSPSQRSSFPTRAYDRTEWQSNL
jgi:anti-sigma factor RsiW